MQNITLALAATAVRVSIVTGLVIVLAIVGHLLYIIFASMTLYAFLSMLLVYSTVSFIFRWRKYVRLQKTFEEINQRSKQARRPF